MYMYGADPFSRDLALPHRIPSNISASNGQRNKKEGKRETASNGESPNLSSRWPAYLVFVLKHFPSTPFSKQPLLHNMSTWPPTRLDSQDVRHIHQNMKGKNISRHPTCIYMGQIPFPWINRSPTVFPAIYRHQTVSRHERQARKMRPVRICLWRCRR